MHFPVVYKKKHFLYINIFFLLYISQTLYPQSGEMVFRYYTSNDGLSHNTVHCIRQDRKGFLWIGTEDGLNMFDGYGFTSFKKNSADTFSLSDNFINCLYFDRNDDLWIGTNNRGISCYNQFTGRFKSFSTYEREGKKEPFRMVYSIVGDSRGHLWLGTFSGLFEFDPEKEEVISQYHYDGSVQSISGEEIRYLFIDGDDILWIGTNNGGLNRFDIKTRTFRYYKHDPNNNSSITNNSVSSILRDSSGKLWVGTSWGLNILDETTGSFRQFYSKASETNSLSDNVIFSIYEDHLHKVWIGTLNGLNQYNRKNDNFFVWKYTPSINPTIIDNYIFSIFEDKFHQVWLGTATNGIGKFNNNLKSFNHYFIYPDDATGVSNNTVREIFEDNNRLLWVGVLNGGLHLVNRDRQKYRSYMHDQAVSSSLSDNRVNTVFRDSRKNIWVGTWDGGLNLAIPENGTYRFEHFYHDPSDPTSIADNVIQEIAEDSRGRLWLGTGSGIDLFDPASKKAIHFMHREKDPNSLAGNDVQSGGIIFDKQGNMWVGTYSGLSKVIISPTTRMPVKFLNYKQNDTSAFSLSDDRIIALNLDENDILWVGTFGGGLNKISLDENGDITGIKSYTEQDGLANNVVYAVLNDNEGFLWLSTNNGLSKFDPVKEKFTNYGVGDGLQNNQFYWGAACRLKSGELAFGGINGFNIFDPAKIFPDTTVPEVVITDVKVNGRVPVLPENAALRNIIYADTISIGYKDKTIAFEFAALHFADPAKNLYKYKLEGFNDDWISTTSKMRYAIFTNLNPGVYTLRVKGSNADGYWNEEGLSIKIMVAPPFWKTWWFYTGVAVILILTLIVIYRLRLAGFRRQKAHLERAVQEKTAEILFKNSVLQKANDEILVKNQKLETQRHELEGLLQSLKETQNKLIQSEKMASLGVLAAGIAHEINNPLNFISLGVEALQDFIDEKMSDEEKAVTPLIGGIKDGVRRAADIVSSLNTYSRKDDFAPSETDVHTVIDSCLVMLNNQLRDRIKVIKEYTGKTLNVSANEGRLHQVFLNILTNAIHSIQDQGVITVVTKINGGRCRVSITDTGCGIKRELIPKITDPFFTTKEPGKGTGLGLSISYSIVQEYGGSIEFESEENAGTTVHISLPIIKETIS